MPATVDRMAIRGKLTRILAGFLGVFFTAVSLLVGFGLGWPPQTGVLLVFLPPALVLAHFGFTGRPSSAALRLWLVCIVLSTLARFVDAENCRDAGGLYGGFIFGCGGACPPNGLLLAGGGTPAVWSIAILASVAASFAVLAATRWVRNRTKPGRGALGTR